jgi:hypothetical protein
MPPLSALPSPSNPSYEPGVEAERSKGRPPHYTYMWTGPRAGGETGQFDIFENDLPLGVHVETEIIALVIVKRLNDWRLWLANTASLAAVIPLTGLHYPLTQRVPHDPPPDTNPVAVRL